MYLKHLIPFLQQTAIVDQVKHFIETRQVVCTGPFIYADVEEVRECVGRRGRVGVLTSGFGWVVLARLIQSKFWLLAVSPCMMMS